MEKRSKPKSSTITQFDEKVVSIPADPCLKHKLYVRLDFTEEIKDKYMIQEQISRFTTYNGNSNLSKVYAGLLDKIVMSKVCLRSNGTINIPSPAELKHCNLTTRGIHTANLKEWSVETKFMSPEHPDELDTILTNMTNIEKCKGDNWLGDAINFSTTNGTAIGIGAVVLVIGIGISVVIRVRCDKQKMEKTYKRETNPLYNMYYTEDGKAIDKE